MPEIRDAKGRPITVIRRSLARRPTAPAVAAPAADRDEVLAQLASRVRRLTIDRHDPHRFFSDRSQIAKEIDDLRRGRRSADATARA